MPTCFIEAPQVIRSDAKKRLVEQISAAADGRLQSENTQLVEALKRGTG
jgi:hypothetical protein